MKDWGPRGWSKRCRGASLGIRTLFSALMLIAGVLASAARAGGFEAAEFTEKYCASCHDDVEAKGGLDLSSLSFDPADAANFARWVKIHDRLAAGEMPPKKKKTRPD